MAKVVQQAIGEITLKNTKAEILEALNEALEREKLNAQMKCEPEKLAEKQKINKAVEDSKENVAKKIFSDELNKKFNDLEIAIQEEERRLQELYDIGKELSNFVIIVNAKNEFECKFEIDKKQKIDEFNSRMDELEKEYETKNDELKKEYILKKSELENQNKQEKIELEKQNKQKSMELDKEYETKNSELEKEYEVKNSELEEKYQSKKTELTREIEEYNYNIKREKKLSNDAWEDEKERREKEISDKENEVLRSYEEVETKKNHLKELEEIVDSMPSKLNDEYQKGRKDAIIEIEKENKYKTELLKKDFEGIVARQNDKIEALQEEITKIAAEKAALQEKLDHAYTQIKDMATKTVEATGGLKILGNNTSDTKS